MTDNLNSSLKLKGNTSCDKMETMAKNSNDTIGISIDNLKKIDGEMESTIETLEVMSNPKTLKGRGEGLQDIKEERTSTFDDFVNKHGYDIVIHTI